jgi:hypothetical protein
MNFCVTDGESVVVTRYISSKKDEAASLVGCTSYLSTFTSDKSQNSGSLLELNSVNMRRADITGCPSVINGRISLW